MYLEISFRKDFFSNELSCNCSCCFCKIIDRKVEDSVLIRKLYDECYSYTKPITHEDVLKIADLAQLYNSSFLTSLQDLCIEVLFNKYPKLLSFIDKLGLPNVMKDQVEDYEMKIKNASGQADQVFLGTFVLLLRHHVGYYCALDSVKST